MGFIAQRSAFRVLCESRFKFYPLVSRSADWKERAETQGGADLPPFSLWNLKQTDAIMNLCTVAKGGWVAHGSHSVWDWHPNWHLFKFMNVNLNLTGHTLQETELEFERESVCLSIHPSLLFTLILWFSIYLNSTCFHSNSNCIQIQFCILYSASIQIHFKFRN